MSNNFLRVLSFFSFPAGVFVFSYVISILFNAYAVYPWIDIPMHFLGGFAIAYTSYLFLRFFREKGYMEINNKALFTLIIVSLVALIAVLWEFYESLMKYFFDTNMQPSLEDTILDLFMGLIGGVVGAWVFRKK